MLADIQVSKAIAGIAQRAERMVDADKVEDTYVEVGILPQLLNTNNQIIYGRRGTGKTHLFRYLENSFKKERNNVIVYVDCRTLGSAPTYNNPDLPLNTRCLSLFKDLIDALYHKFLEYIINEAPKEAEKAYEALDNVYVSTNFVSTKSSNREVTERRLDKTSSEGGISAGADLKATLNLNISSKNSEATDVEKTLKATEAVEEKVLFPDLHYWLTQMLSLTNTTVYYLIDEWSSLPYELQPYLAEFIKRSFLPIARVSIKIAALEYRSNFTIQGERNFHLGFELGSDISTNLDLDDYYVFDRNPNAITSSFGEIMYKHIINDLPSQYLLENYNIKDAKDFIRTMFTDSANFRELVRASEGVIRDMINIYTLSFFDAQRQGRQKIDKTSVLESSRQWFERDKAQNLDDSLSQILRLIVDEVIGAKKARSFLIPRQLEKNNNLQKLFDARVIHFIKRGYADKDNPGVRYNVYGLDYGTYVDLLNTKQKPELDFQDIELRDDLENFVVPFDDKRSIRRIILTADILS